MAINKNKVMEAAQKFVEKNQLDKAIKEYLKIVEEDPKDVRVWLKLGDLHAKKGAKQEATETYLRVAQFYSDQGFYLKAVAVYKQVLRLDPRLIEVNIRLAEVYRQLGLLSDAMQQYELVAAFFHREGKTREALATVRELVELDPENVATRIKLAELYSKEQMIKEAVAEFGKAAEYLRANGRMDDFIKVAERLVWHQPDNHAMNRELAQLYLRRNDARHALQKLQVCFKADPRDIDTLALLASAFLALDQRQKTVSVWKELARIHTENNQAALAQDVYRRILSVAPDDPDALAAASGRRAMGTGNPPSISTPSVSVSAPALPVRPAPALVTPIGSEPSERPVPRLATPGSSPQAPTIDRPPVSFKGPARVASPMTHGQSSAMPPVRGMAARPVASSISDGVALEVDEEREPTTRSRHDATLDLDPNAPSPRAKGVARLLDVADVCTKYGLRDKAVQQLQRLLELDPRSVDARARLKDNYTALARPVEAAVELVHLVELTAANDSERAQEYLRELAGIAPDDARVNDLISRYGLRSPAETAGEDLEIEIMGGSSPPGSVDSSDVMLDGASGDETTEIGDEALPDDDEMTVIGEGTMELDSAELAVEVSDPADDSVDHELAFDEMSSASTEQGERTVDGTSTSLDGLDDLAADDSEVGLEVAIDPGDAALAESMGPTSYPAPVGEAEFDPAPATERPIGLPRTSPGTVSVAPGTSLEDDLDEADFFVSQTLYDEARAILSDLLARYPSHPLIMAKLRDLPQEEGAAAVVSGGPAEASRSGGGRKPAVIAKSEGGHTGADTHFDLGMAYKEMGLHEEALKEFALARQAPGRAVQSYLMLGLCQVELGRVAEAVEAFKAGLYVEGINEREALALYFELGLAYEALGDSREALYYFEKVQKRDPRFRDVERKVEALAPAPSGRKSNGGRDKPPIPRPEPRSEPRDDDDALASIDALLDEHDSTPS